MENQVTVVADIALAGFAVDDPPRSVERTDRIDRMLESGLLRLSGEAPAVVEGAEPPAEAVEGVSEPAKSPRGGSGRRAAAKPAPDGSEGA